MLISELKRRQWYMQLIVIFTLSLFPAALHAVGLMDVLQSAMKNDPVLQAAYFKQQGVLEHRSQAFAHLLPNLFASAEEGTTTQDIKDSDNTVFEVGNNDYTSTKYGLTLTQPLFRWESFVGYQQAKIEVLRSQVEYHIAVQDLILRAADLYMKALVAQDQLTFDRAEYSAVEKHFELASGQFEKGLIPITDMHDAKARQASVSAKIIEDENTLQDAFQALQEITGGPVSGVDALQNELPLLNPDPVDPATWVTTATKQNPAIILQQYTIEIADKEIKRQKAGHLPTVDLVGSFNNADTGGSLYGGGSNIDTTEVAVRLSVPLYQGGMVSSKTREAIHMQSAARQELVRQIRAVERRTGSACLGVESAIKRIEALQQSVESNELALEAKKTGFMSGIYTGIAVLDAERDLYRTKQDYSKVRYDYLLNSLKLKKETDTLTEADIQRFSQYFK